MSRAREVIRSLEPGSGVLLAVSLAACTAVTLPRFLLDSTGAIQQAPLPWAAALTFYWCTPLAVLVAFGRTRVVAVAGAAVYIVAAVLWLAAVYRSEHSTAGFGVMFGPIYFGAAVVLVLGTEAALVRVSAQKRRSTSDSMPRSSS